MWRSRHSRALCLARLGWQPPHTVGRTRSMTSNLLRVGYHARVRGRLALLLFAACNAQIAGGGSAAPDAKQVDGAPIDTPKPPPDGLGPWNPPLQIPGANTPLDEDDGTLSNDGLELFFAAVDPGDGNRKHLYTVTRANTQTMVWTPPQKL